MPRFDVVLAGHFARDRDVYQGKARPMLGGSVYFGGHALASLGVRGAILTRLAEQDRYQLDDLEARGIQVFCRYGTETSGIENTYLDATRDRRHCKPIAVGEPFQVGDFPRMRVNIVHVAPLLKGEVPREFVEFLAGWGRLSLDAQGFLRVHREGTLKLERSEEFESMIRGADFLKVDHAEAETMTGRKELNAALERLREMGAMEIVLTHATGVIVCKDGKTAEAPWTASSLPGRTGRGDTCMSTYLACRALELGPEEALPIAAELTSRKMEKEGPYRGSLASLSPEVTAPLQKRLAELGIVPPQG
jgi:hypothetical protein